MNHPAIDKRDYLTVNEAASLLGIERHTAARLISEGTFPVPVVDLGPRSRRVPKAAVFALLQGRALDNPGDGPVVTVDPAAPITRQTALQRAGQILDVASRREPRTIDQAVTLASAWIAFAAEARAS